MMLLESGFFDWVTGLANEGKDAINVVMGFVAVFAAMLIAVKGKFSLTSIISAICIGALIIWMVPLGGYSTIANIIKATF